jgi:hypothetical protein
MTGLASGGASLLLFPFHATTRPLIMALFALIWLDTAT